MSSAMISKSAFLAGLQCDKLLWARSNTRNQITPTDGSLQTIFDQGHEVGVIARRLLAGGVEVAAGVMDPTEVVRASRDALRVSKPLFEAGFTFDGMFARADVLVPAGRAGWDLYKVKGVTEPKEIHFKELTFQVQVITGAGLLIRRCFLVYSDRDYVREGDLEPDRLFIRRDCTREVRELRPTIDHRLAEMRRLIAMAECPTVPIGAHCDAPYACPLRGPCWAFLPEHNVMELYRGKAKGFALLEHGVKQMAEIPAQHGSASMKAVLPALTGRGYDDLEIRDGDMASREYLRVTYGRPAPNEREHVRRQLEQYCGLDTRGMWQIVAALRDLV